MQMEYRDDLRALLLQGLPAGERHETLRTIADATAKKLAKLRQAPAEEDSAEVDEAEKDLSVA
jgi:hypothetical protein